MCKISNCNSTKIYARDLCFSHYYKFKCDGTLDQYPSKRKTQIGSSKQFLDYLLKKQMEDKCIEWPFCLNNGYPYIAINRESTNVKQLICEKIHGKAKKGQIPVAICDSKNCVEPFHLKWGYRKPRKKVKLVDELVNWRNFMQDGNIDSLASLAKGLRSLADSVDTFNKD